jgi:hypothetical protein
LQIVQDLLGHRTESAEELLEQAIEANKAKGEVGIAASSARHLAALAAGRDPIQELKGLQEAVLLEPEDAASRQQLSALPAIQEQSAVSRAFSVYRRKAQRQPIAHVPSPEFTLFNRRGLDAPLTALSRPLTLYTIAHADEAEAIAGRAYGIYHRSLAPPQAVAGRESSLSGYRPQHATSPSREITIWQQGEQR